MYYQFSDAEIENQFFNFLRDNGLEPVEEHSIDMSGKIHRYRTARDKKGETSGAYCVYPDGIIPAGWAMDWHEGVSYDWKYDLSSLPEATRKHYSDPEQKKKIREEAEQRKKQREKEIEETRLKAADNARIRINTLPEAEQGHPYLVRKQVYCYGLKLDSDNALAVPLYNADGIVQSLQNIYPNGEKRLFPGASKRGLFWSIALDIAGKNPDKPILIGEGYATMAKIYELTGYPCVMAVDCHNLVIVAKILHTKYPTHKIIITADNDKATELKVRENPGINAAKKAVEAGDAVDYVAPEFDRPEDGTDWDDFAILYGDDKAERVLRDKINHALIPPAIKAMEDRVEIINAEDLRTMTFPPVKWAVEGFLPSGLSILAGGPKVGKSILALHLSVGVAIGGRVLSSIDVTRGAVLYLALEDTRRRLQQRINSGEFANVDADMSRLDIVTSIPRQHQGGLEYIRYWLETHQDARLVIIDTLQMFRRLLSGKGSMYSEDYETVSNIKKVADEFDVPFLVIHHLKKGMEGDWLSEISGSQGIAGAADTIFSLKRERNSTLGTLHRTGRDVEEKDFSLKLDGFGWTLLGEIDTNAAPEWKKQVLDFLKDHQSVTPMQLAEAANISYDAAKKNLQRLTRDGTLIRKGHGIYELPKED